MKKRRLRLFLLFSIALNFFFIGGLPFIAKKKFEERQLRSFPTNVAWVIQGLNQKDLPAFLERHSAKISEQQPIAKALLRRLRESQGLAYELITVEPFDRRALVETFSVIRDTNLAYQKVSHNLVAELLEEIEPKNRKTVSRYLKKVLNPKPKRNAQYRVTEDSTQRPARPPRPPQAPNLVQ